ncbi:carboxylating nicotinate-nucleotide diphosphorylase [Halobacillus litoralis]|uniref:carboxylating nicotinate-nucleotide diphosphorylase n=1 Tax=Halobacillus litoralis TaxID=45668 RepID=UPI001CFDA2BF|nr:carboxylating nicotinate-nucleotide diphosphorylase [Halobacillus litoralis]
MNRLKLKQKLEEFFMEDIGDHDLSSDFLFSQDQYGRMTFSSKAGGVFCGASIIEEGFHLLDPAVRTHLHFRDGDDLAKGDCISTMEGPMVSLLKGERVILNLIQRMSGIATLTKQASHLLDSEKTRICDTRKTTPGLRFFEKYAVRTGGGFNHRNGLYDAVMLKDNHIALFGSITQAVDHVKKNIGHMVKIEVETETEAQVIEAVEAGVDCIMFDNRTPAEIKCFMKHVPPFITTEASGGITLEKVPEFRGLDLDYLSLGFLTHSAKALDISARAVSMKEEVQ